MNKVAQFEICRKYGVEHVESPEFLKAGVSINIKTGSMPINGLRHQSEEGTTGWFLWSGEVLSGDPGFFVPVHVSHLNDWCPIVLKYLGLPPGYRFLIDNNGYEDVWYDQSLIQFNETESP